MTDISVAARMVFKFEDGTILTFSASPMGIAIPPDATDWWVSRCHYWRDLDGLTQGPDGAPEPVGY